MTVVHVHVNGNIFQRILTAFQQTFNNLSIINYLNQIILLEEKFIVIPISFKKRMCSWVLFKLMHVEIECKV